MGILETLLFRAIQARKTELPKVREEIINPAPFQGRIAPGEVWRAPVRRVLFLDYDGVLHPGESGTFRYAPKLEAVLRQNPAVDIVISSNWRERMPFRELVEPFAADIAARIVGSTPALPGQNRQAEVEAFCRAYGVDDWLVVDDRPELFSTFYWRLRLIEGGMGIRDTDLEMIREWVCRGTAPGLPLLAEIQNYEHA